MLMRKAKVKNDGSREFSRSWLYRFTSIIGVGVMLSFALGIMYTAPWYTTLCFVPPFVYFGWLGLLESIQMKLIVREDGLEYRFGSSSVLTLWENLRDFAYRANGRTLTTVIELRSSIRQQVQGSKLEKIFFGEELARYIPLSNIVPVPLMYDKEKKIVRVNTGKFAKTPFGQDLLHYAPHLFEKEFINAKSQS
jgi:hypothetical protein